MTLAVIGGTGFGAFAGLAEVQDHRIKTPYGSAEVQTGKLNGRSLIFLPRHGMPAPGLITRSCIMLSWHALKTAVRPRRKPAGLRHIF